MKKKEILVACGLVTLGLVALTFFANYYFETGKLFFKKSPTPTSNSTTDEVKEKVEIIEVIGSIYSMGNAPFTQLVIEADNGTVYGLISTNKVTGLWESQVRRAKVKGYLLGRTPPSFRTEKSIDVIDFKVVK